MSRRTFSIGGILITALFAVIFVNYLNVEWYAEYAICFSSGWIAGFAFPAFYDKYLTKDEL